MRIQSSATVSPSMVRQSTFMEQSRSASRALVANDRHNSRSRCTRAEKELLCLLRPWHQFLAGQLLVRHFNCPGYWYQLWWSGATCVWNHHRHCGLCCDCRVAVRAGLGNARCWWTVLLDEPTCLEEICEVCVLPDRMDRLGWFSLHLC